MMIKLMGKRIRVNCINYMDYLTDDMIDLYEKAFRQADESGDGELDKDEIRHMLKHMGISMDRKSFDELFKEVDRDMSGKIEFDEYCAMMVKLTGVRKRINAREYTGLQIRALKFQSSSSTFPRARTCELRRARSRLYRSQMLQVNTRWKALAEIYTMHSFAPFLESQFVL